MMSNKLLGLGLDLECKCDYAKVNEQDQ